MSPNGSRLSGYAQQRGCYGSHAVLSTQARTKMCEVGVLRCLVAPDGREPWTRAGLECGVGGDPLDLSDALHNLRTAGVIHLSEERVILSRTARERITGLGLLTGQPCHAIW